MKYVIKRIDKKEKVYTQFKFWPVKEFMCSAYKQLFDVLGKVPSKETTRAVYYELEGDHMRYGVLGINDISRIINISRRSEQC